MRNSFRWILLIAFLVAVNNLIMGATLAISDDVQEIKGEPFDIWLIKQLEEDENNWDRIKELVEPVQKRLAYDNVKKEVILLNQEIPDSVFSPMSAKPNEDSVLRYFSDSPSQPARLRPYLSSGGYWNFFTLNPLLAGHYDVTLMVLTEKGFPWSFTDEAAEFVADASRDPDIFQWTKPQAHAQTGLVNRELRPLNEKNQKLKYYSFERKLIQEINAACENKDYPLALYKLGWALHGIQDLASHKGMTNAEHAWLGRHDRDPDEIESNIELAKTLTRYFLSGVISEKNKACYENIRAQTEKLEPWTYVQAKNNLRIQRDFTLEEYQKYKALGKAADELTTPTINATAEAKVPSVIFTKKWFHESEWQKPIDELRAFIK
ncbi:MAG: hypothetical protein MRJ67_10875 [Nitrospirales bacterium]|nr:hypothetical protein [Nitrospirales bacterium]